MNHSFMPTPVPIDFGSTTHPAAATTANSRAVILLMTTRSTRHARFVYNNMHALRAVALLLISQRVMPSRQKGCRTPGTPPFGRHNPGPVHGAGTPDVARHSFRVIRPDQHVFRARPGIPRRGRRSERPDQLCDGALGLLSSHDRSGNRGVLIIIVA
jgi:hypothetical protein